MGFFFVADAIIEIIGIHAGIYSYYGEHFKVFDWPPVFGFLNASITFFGGALFYLLLPRLFGFNRVLLFFVVPSAYAGIYAIAGWPTWAAVNSGVSWWIVLAASCVTAYLCVSSVRLVDSALSLNRTV